MKIRIFAFSLMCATGLWGQHHRFSWQEACFKNPAAPFCPGHDFAIKPQPPTKNGGTHTSGADSDPIPSTLEKVQPSVIVVGAIDWRFVDPSADALVGFNAGRLSASPLGRSLIAQLGAGQGITEAAMRKILEGLSGVDQVALSICNNRIVVMLTGRAADANIPGLEMGWKAVPVAGSSMLVGHAEAVDQAVARLAIEGPPAEVTRLAAQRQADSDFWALGSTGLAGTQAVTAGLKRFSLTVSIGDRLTSDAAFEFSAAPDAATLQMWPATPGGVTVDGNVVHARMSVDTDEAPQKVGQMAASPLGQRLADLVGVTRYLPVRDANLPKKPVIYGLDDGPKPMN